MEKTIRRSLLISVVFAASAAAFLFLRHDPPKALSPLVPQDKETFVLQGVRLLEVVPVDYPRGIDFGKGKFVLFDFSTPAGQDLLLERVVIEKQGASDTEMPEAWLRLNSVRVYTTARFENGHATFTAFPSVIEPETWNAEPETVFKEAHTMGIPYDVLQDGQEKQLVLHPLQPLPQLLQSGSDVSFGIYGRWTDSIASRAKENGIRFCLKEISGTLLPSGQKATTRFAQKMCGERMGIRD